MGRLHGSTPWVVASALVLALAALPVRAQRLTYTGGAFYAGGGYVFDTRSEAFYFSNGLRLDVGRFGAGVSLPLITQNGGVVTRIAGGVPLPTGGASSGVVAGRREGGTIGTRGRGTGGGGTIDSTIVVFDERYATHWGDPTLDASAQLYSGLGTVRAVRFAVTTKAPLADVDTGVGSGAWDFAAGGSVTLGVGATLIFADATYWWLGDLPDLELSDGLAYATGVSFRAPFASVLLMLSGMSRSIETVEPPLSVSGSLSRAVGARLFLSGGVGAGLTESAPDLSIFIGWSVRL